MGSDIHGVFQAKAGDGWRDIPSSWKQNRHYFLFAFLGDVRNGEGFGGCKTFDPIEPVAPGRGFPEDFERVDETHPVRDKALLVSLGGHPGDGHEDGIWMGDHSHSWATGEEILSASLRLGSTRRYGVIDINEFRRWDGQRPEAFSGGIFGRDISVAPRDGVIGPKTTHVAVDWLEDDRKSIEYFLDEVQRLVDEHGEIRLVFGFDS